MRLNKRSGKMYKKVSHTGTFIKGCLVHECVYCFVKHLPWGVSQTPALVGDECARAYVENAFVFLNSCHDAYSPGMPGEWISAQHRFIGRQHPSNKWLEQTKNTPRFKEHLAELYEIKDRMVIGTTYETNRVKNVLHGIPYSAFSKAVDPQQRARDMTVIHDIGFETMGSLEPLMAFDPEPMAKDVIRFHPTYVEVGLDSRNHGLPMPEKWAYNALKGELLDAGIEVIEKDTLVRWLNAES